MYSIARATTRTYSKNIFKRVLLVNGIKSGFPTPRYLGSFPTGNSFVSYFGGPNLGNISARKFSTKTVECPPLGDSITEGTIASWLKSPGDTVDVDETVLEIETDKISVEVRSPSAGVISELKFEEGDVIEIGSELFVVEEGAAPAATESASKESAETSKAESPAPEQKSAPKAATPAESPKQAPAPPKASKAAPSSSPSSTVSVPGSRTEKRVKMKRMRVTIAGRMKESQNTAASLTTFNEIDMSTIMSLRSKHKDAFMERHGVKLGFMSAFVKASTLALQEFPNVNGVIDGDEIVYRDYVDISVAVATPTGLVVPVLRNTETMSFADIEGGIAQLGKKARDGKLSLEEMTGGTFTISNGGVYGSLMGTPIINMPQTAILGMHGIFERPVAINGEVKIRPMMYIALTYDHRLVDGKDAVMFLRKIKSIVEDPSSILMH